MFKISYCTPVKGRLEHLKQTLPSNLKNTDNDTEFVILNYSDKDGLDDWVKGLSKAHRQRVSYYIHQGAEGYDHSIAKNIAHKQAKGDFLVNLDADNFLGDNANQLLRNALQNQNKKVIVTCKVIPGVIGLWKETFEALGGYDEDLKGWGCEDNDLTQRAENWGCKSIALVLPGTKRIEHDDSLRMKNIGGHKLHSLTAQRGIHFKKMREGKLIANVGRPWGVINPPPNIDHKG